MCGMRIRWAGLRLRLITNRIRGMSRRVSHFNIWLWILWRQIWAWAIRDIFDPSIPPGLPCVMRMLKMDQLPPRSQRLEKS